MTASGSSQSTGDRYVTMSRIATTSAVTMSSVMLAPVNEFAMSAPNAGSAGYVGDECVSKTVLRFRAQALDRVVEREAGKAGGQWHRRECSLLIFRDDRRRTADSGYRGEIGGAQHPAVGAGDDEDRRGLLTPGELCGCSLCPRRFSCRRK
jgi:hypothetical protein